MNILLDAYFDGNFGDDVFVQCITNRFPNYKFYAFLEYYPEVVCEWAESIPNLYLLPECNVFLQKNMFDAYICVGGDIFPDKGNYDKRKSYVKSVKECGGVVAYIGFSLFKSYSEPTRQDICELMEQADMVAPRDCISTELLKHWLPHKEIHTMADLAFSYFERGKGSVENKEILGVSIRKPGDVSDEVIEGYCDEMADLINAFLDKDSERQVRIFSLSTGVWNDMEIAQKILSMLKSSDRVMQYVYEGEISNCYEAMAECQLMICTRLHALVAAIALGIKCVPVIYEVKQENILKEIDYKGRTFAFHNLKGISDYVEELWTERNIQWQEVDLERYLEKSKCVLNGLSELLAGGLGRSVINKVDSSGVLCEEKQYAKVQVAEVQKKNMELEALAASMKELQHILQNCQSDNENYLQELEACNKRNEEYFGIIETQNRNYQELERIKNEYIDSLSSEKNRLDSVIVEKQQEENRLNGIIAELNGNRQIYEDLQEERNQLYAELEMLKEKEVQYTEILSMIRPYFMSGRGNFITKQMSGLLELKEKGSKENWDKIQKFYE